MKVWNICMWMLNIITLISIHKIRGGYCPISPVQRKFFKKHFLEIRQQLEIVHVFCTRQSKPVESAFIITLVVTEKAINWAQVPSYVKQYNEFVCFIKKKKIRGFYENHWKIVILEGWGENEVNPMNVPLTDLIELPGYSTERGKFRLQWIP